MKETLRPELEELPARLRSLHVFRGYPVPWFVAWIGENGFAVEPGTPGSVPEFRVADASKFAIAVRGKLCWVCGEQLGRYMTFVLGPMCGINRTSAEPPCHAECAQWSARNCPFLSKPQMVRRENDMPAEECAPAGVMLKRNPGVTLLWTTKSYTVNRHDSGYLVEVGEPLSMEWWSLGKHANRAQVVASVESGIGTLEEMAQQEEGAMDELLKRKAWLESRYPA